MAKKYVFKTINNLVAHYNQHGYIHQQKELQQYSLNDLSGLVTGYIPRVLVNGKIRRVWCCGRINVGGLPLVTPYLAPHPHQWWIKKTPKFKKRVEAALLTHHILTQKYTSFDDLYDTLRKKKISSGELFIYDLTRRISHCLQLRPSKYVYLHNGAKDGAEELNRRGKITLPNGWSVRVDISVFRKIFPNMDSIDIENVLCIYKNDFAYIP